MLQFEDWLVTPDSLAATPGWCFEVAAPTTHIQLHKPLAQVMCRSSLLIRTCQRWDNITEVMTTPYIVTG